MRRIALALGLMFCVNFVLPGPIPPPTDKWRTPRPFQRVTGPSELRFGGEEAAKLKSGTRGDAVPELLIEVADAAGKPVQGLAVWVLAQYGKKGSERIRLGGATGADGRVVALSDAGAKARRMSVVFAWDDVAKTIEVGLEPHKNRWRIAEAPYKRIVDGKNEGSCRNLFRLEKLENHLRYSMKFRLPQTLLECEEVAYGVERKVQEMVRIARIGRRDVNAGDKNAFTPADEMKMGFEASAQFDRTYRKIDDPQIVGYVDALMKKVIAFSDDPKMPLHLRVVHTDDVNAFATAGGHVYVFTGLIAAVENESQLAGVLAHEASHVIARHVTEGATRDQKAQAGAAIGSLALGTLLGLDPTQQDLLIQSTLTATGLVAMKYDRRSESEADLLGSQYLWNAGWDPEAIARFFERLEKQSDGASVPAWLSTHPTHEKRVENGIQWARAFLPPKDRYLVDTAAFQEVKARVAGLPKPPADPAAQAR